MLTHLSLALENTGHLRLKISIYEKKKNRVKDLIYCIKNIGKTVIWDCRVLLPITNAVAIPLKNTNMIQISKT